MELQPRNAVLGGRDACGHRHWGLRWRRPVDTAMWTPPLLGWGDACGHRLRSLWGLRWSSPWGHKELCW
eukprot:6369692-Pyramimonas_sp.AAC.1